MTEEQMLEGSKINNASAQEFLYNKFSPKMLGVCYRYAYNREDAEDMLQEGFIKVFRQLHQFRNDGPIEGWVRRVVVNTCINIIKKNKKFDDTIDISNAATIQSKDAFIPSIIQAKEIVECIRLLPLGYRTVLNLYAIEGYSHHEISRMLEIEEVTSRSQYARAKKMLESILINKEIIERPFKKSAIKTSVTVSS